MNTVHYFIGIPGSGKTHCSTELAKNLGIPYYGGEFFSTEESILFIKDNIEENDIVVDSKIRTGCILQMYIHDLEESGANVGKLIIYCFEENRKACRINDEYRSKTSDREKLPEHIFNQDYDENPSVYSNKFLIEKRKLNVEVQN